MLESYVYCPILHSRQAEMKALQQLPSASKNQLFPLIVARPWPNAKSITKTWERISSAVGSNRFALDLDDSRITATPEKSALIEFNALFEDADGFRHYYDTVEGIPNAIPVLRLSGPTQFSIQAKHVDRLDRGAVLRVQYENRGLLNSESLAEIFDHFPDLSVFIDAGWSKDILAREAWVSAVIRALLNLREELEIVVVGTSFPDTFKDIHGRGTWPLAERTMFANLKRQHNQARLIYGDWGSTRPSTDPTPMKVVPRLDLPTRGSWVFFRQDNQDGSDESYPELAKRMMRDLEWPAGLAVWGTYVIQCTASGVPGGIRSPATAVAARVNIHLHQQAFFDAPSVTSDSEEPYTDD